MTKEELITRLVDLLDTVEDINQESFDDGEIEDLIVEARLPISLCSLCPGRRTLREG